MASSALPLGPAPFAPDELVDPYATALAIAYQLAPEESQAELALEEILVEYCEQESIDVDALLEDVGEWLAESAKPPIAVGDA